MERKGPSHCWLGPVSRAGLMSRYSALPLCVTGRAEPFFCRLRSSLVQSVFFGQRPQPPLGTCSSAPKICSLEPSTPPRRSGHPRETRIGRMSALGANRTRWDGGIDENDPGCVKTHTSSKCEKYNSPARDRAVCPQHDLTLMIRNFSEIVLRPQRTTCRGLASSGTASFMVGA